MRNIFLILLTVIQISTIYRAHAGAVIGATFPQQMVDNIVHVMNEASTAATDLSTAAMKVYQTIDVPVQTMLLTAAQQAMATEMVRFVNGGFEGEPLIVSNTLKSIRQEGHLAAKGVLDSIPVNSIYGESIFVALTDQYTDFTDLEQIEALTASAIPSIIKEDICSDARLTELVEDEAMDENNNIDPVLLKQKKQELFDYACVEDPNDPEQAARLQDLSDQNQSIGGWDKWLATTGGDNQFSRKEGISTFAAEKKATAAQNKKDEIYLGAGPVSQTKCVKFGKDLGIGTEKICLEKVTLSPGDTIGTILERSANSGIDRLTNLTQGGLTGLITTIAMNKLAKGLNTAFSEIEGTISGSTGGGSNTGAVVTKKSPVVQDLAGEADTKKSILSPMMAQLNNFSEGLDTARTAIQAYLIDVNAYESRISSGRACYDSLVGNNLTTPENPQVTAAYDFYNDRQAKIDAIKNPLLAELKKVSDAKKLIADTTAELNSSNSTQEISSIFNAYMTKVNGSDYPDTKTAAQREGERRKSKTEADADKDVDKFQATCDQLGGGNNGGGYSGPGGI